MKVTLPRDVFIPKPELNAKVLNSNSGTAIAYVWEEIRAGKQILLAKGFTGRKNKPTFFYRFNTIERRDNHVNEFLASADKKYNSKVERKQQIKEEKAAINAIVDAPVGTVFAQVWGWEQTNATFFKVLEVKSRTKIVVQHCGSKLIQSNSMGMTGQVIADADKLEDKPMVVSLKSKNRFNVPKCSSYAWGTSASTWDGKPIHISWYA